MLEGHRVLDRTAGLRRRSSGRGPHAVLSLAEEFDVELFAFQDKSLPPETAPFCARVVLAEKPRYREPRWSTLLPPDVCEFDRRPCAAHWRRSGERSASTFCRWNVRN
jgi:hypothetical protein